MTMPTEVNITTSLIQFRTAYMRSIADYWADKPTPESGPNFFENRMTMYGGCVPWNTMITFQESPLMKWNYYNASFIGPFDAFLIRLPKAPEPDQQAQAIAGYYDLFPTILGGGQKARNDSLPAVSINSSGLDEIDPAFSFKEHPIPPYWTFIPHPQGDEIPHPQGDEIPHPQQGKQEYDPSKEGGGAGTGRGLGDGGPETFLNFGALLLHIITRAWQDKAFKGIILQGTSIDKEKKVIKLNPLESVAPTLRSIYLVTNPWNFNIFFAESKNFCWKKAQGDEAGTWQNVPPNQIILNLPQAPEETLLRPRALSVYNDSGPAYPFSCT